MERERNGQLDNCERCGVLFLKQRTSYCTDCTQWFAEKYNEIRTYLRTHPNRNIWDVQHDLDIPAAVIRQVLKYAEE